MSDNLERAIRDAAARVADEVIAATEGGDRNPDEALGDWLPFRRVIEALHDAKHNSAMPSLGCKAGAALDAITGAKEKAT